MSALTQSLALHPSQPSSSANCSSSEPTMTTTVSSPPPPSLTIPLTPRRPSIATSVDIQRDQPCSSSSSLSSPVAARQNEHLAVLLPKHLWKPDWLSTCCDNLFCRAKFSLFERRHHCRKCGDVFCHPCSSRLTDLLDTSSLGFLHPPPNTSIHLYHSATSPVSPQRVCDCCYDQIHGASSSRTPDLIPFTSSPVSLSSSSSHPLSIFNDNDDARSFSVTSSSSSASISTPPDSSLILHHPSSSASSTHSSSSSSHPLHSPASQSSLTSSPSRRQRAALRPRYQTMPAPTLVLPEEQPLGELDAYPLKRASSLCKATGGGRWTPKAPVVQSGYRVPVPGGKAPFEEMMEREEKLRRQKRENPVVRDGEFQYRFISKQDLEPSSFVPSRSLVFSTF